MKQFTSTDANTVIWFCGYEELFSFRITAGTWQVRALPMIFFVRPREVANETAPYSLLAVSCNIQYGISVSVSVISRWRCFETQRYLWLANRHEDL